METSARNRSLDLLKFISAFLVICIHARFPEPLGFAVVAVARLAVPVFFMITGYYYTATCQRGRQVAQIKKIFRLYLFTNLFYFLYRFLQNALDGTVADFFKALASPSLWLDFLVFGESPFCYLLWYFSALLYLLLAVFLFEKKFDRKYLYPLVPLLLIGNLCIGGYSELLLGRSFSLFYIRNFLFFGLPFFLLGDLLARYRIMPKTRDLIALSLGGIALSLGEHFLMMHLGVANHAELFIGSIIAAPALLLLAAKHPTAADRPVLRQLAFCGEALSLYVYFLHPFVIEQTISLVSRFGGELAWQIYAKIQPVWALIFTTLLGYLIYSAQKLTRK